MNKKVLNIIRRLKLFMNKANNSNDMNLYIQVGNLASCLFHLGHMTIEEYNLLSEEINGYWQYEKIVNETTCRKIKELISHNQLLLKLYWNLYKQYEIQNIHYAEYTVNGKNIKQAIEEFFSMLNCRPLYDELQFTGKIIRFDSSDSQSWCINDNGSSYLLLHNYPAENSRYYTCLIHEMGHAYVNHILKGKSIYLEEKIFSETIPFLFERLFHQFLYENNFITKDEYERMVLNFKANCKSKLKLGVMSSQIIESGKYSLHGIKVIPESGWNSNNQFETISTNIEIDCTPWLSLKWTDYIIADIASYKLFCEYQKDKNQFISELPRLVKNLSNLNIDEMIEKYC